MQDFAYEARNEQGQLVSGILSAQDVEQAGQMLSERSLFVVRVAVDFSQSKRSRERGHASREQVAWCMSQLSVMVETGITFSEALSCLSRQAVEPRLKLILEQVSKSVEEGRPFSEALEMFPRSFPPTLTALIRASEMSGSLAQMLRRSSAYLMNDVRTVKQARGAVIYPAFILVVCVTVTVFLLTVILPKFAGIFAARHAVLPGPTRFLMAISSNLVSNWYLWIAAMLACFVVAAIWSRTAVGKRQRDSLLLLTPVISNVCHAFYQSRTFRTMAILLEAGVPLVEIIRFVRASVDNVHYRQLWEQVDEEIRRGGRMSGPLLASPLIAEPIAQMIDCGERSGKLGFVFTRLSEFVEEEYSETMKNALRFIEPAMILFMGVVVGFIAAALMLPLFQISRVAAG